MRVSNHVMMDGTHNDLQHTVTWRLTTEGPLIHSSTDEAMVLHHGQYRIVRAMAEKIFRQALLRMGRVRSIAYQVLFDVESAGSNLSFIMPTCKGSEWWQVLMSSMTTSNAFTRLRRDLFSE